MPNDRKDLDRGRDSSYFSWLFGTVVPSVLFYMLLFLLQVSKYHSDHVILIHIATFRTRKRRKQAPLPLIHYDTNANEIEMEDYGSEDIPCRL